MFVGLHARTRFFSSAHTFSIGLRSGLCDGHSNTLTLLSLSHFATTLEVCLGSLSIWKTHLRPSFNFLTDVLRCVSFLSGMTAVLSHGVLPFCFLQDKLFPQAIDYLQKVFQVRRKSGPILLSRQCVTNQYLRKKDDPHRYCQGSCADITKCGPVIVPEHHLQQCKVCSETGRSCGSAGPLDGNGVERADFVLYVSGVTTERCGQENIVAYAAYCQLESELDRPIAGYANLCPNMISTQPQEFESMLSTVKHEIIHALGFSAGLFAFYHDYNGKPLTPRFASGLPAFNESLGLYQWSDAVIRRVTRLWDIRGGVMVRHEVHLLVTPRVVEEARRHFGCPILEGMELENQGGMGTELNHWEKRLLENEAMTGSHTQNRVFSRITLAIMEDTGRKVATPYCDTVRATPLQLTCRQDQLAVAVCNLQKYPQDLPLDYQYFDQIPDVSVRDVASYGGAVEIADYCPFSQEFSWHLSGEYQRNSYCRVQENQPGNIHFLLSEAVHSLEGLQNSRNIHNIPRFSRNTSWRIPSWMIPCWNVPCSPSGLTVWVQDTAFQCVRSGQLLRVSVRVNDWVYNGVLVCPACSDFCSACPLPQQLPPLNSTRRVPIDPCSSSSSLVVTLWLLLFNLIPLLAGFILCVRN
uniref:Leishmanolysin-like peptidase n=1 Tax=Hucho hucho TaxID=62062 RepID=A0A4W5MQY3_9TELE